MLDSTDRGPGDEVDHAATRTQLDEQAALAHALHSHLTDLAAAVARCEDGTYGLCQMVPTVHPDRTDARVPDGNPLRAVQAAGAATLTKRLPEEDPSTAVTGHQTLTDVTT